MDLDKRMDRVEKRLDATLKIVQTGMKMLVKMERENGAFRNETRESQKRTDEAIHALIESQMRTGAVVSAMGLRIDEMGRTVTALGVKIDRFVDSLGTGRNGSNGSKGGGRRN